MVKKPIKQMHKCDEGYLVNKIFKTKDDQKFKLT